MKKSRRAKEKKNVHNNIRNEIIGLCIVVISLLMGLSLYTIQGGVIGNLFRRFVMGLFGISSYSLPLFVLLVGIGILQKNIELIHKYKILAPLLFLNISTLAHVIYYGKKLTNQVYFSVIDFTYYRQATWNSGGFLGSIIGNTLLKLIGDYGSYVVLVAFTIIVCIIITNISFMSLLNKLAGGIKKKINIIKQKSLQKKEEKKRKKELIKTIESSKNEKPSVVYENLEPSQEPQIQTYDKPAAKEAKQEVAATIDSLEISNVLDEKKSPMYYNYKFPSIDFLKKGEAIKNTEKSKQATLNNARKLEKTLQSFGVEAKILNIHKGPTVTRYELQPKTGVKVSKIVNLADDIALNLAATGIRIEAPIPGKAAVGIEVPNPSSSPVYLREVIEHETFLNFPSKLAFALGKDIGGQPIVTDISKMPHLLIAGATGSGKSVCINTLITSILYKAHPSEVKLIMIDPKVVELNVYNGIPHLLIPVVTDPKKAASALHWAVQEMGRRYNLFAENNVRDMSGYNSKISEENSEEKMPHIVIIIDELADLMMSSANEVEDAICRLAQMARAAGIHLVIATQRPSVDVITGVIKANIPSRLAFAVSSGTDSRTIIDMNGAEKLLGKGDMLFYPVGSSKPVRIQGAFISDKEVENIVESIKSHKEPEYQEDVLQVIESRVELQSKGEETDELLESAIEAVLGKEKVSISFLQRILRVGFNRASRLMDSLYEMGIVGPDEGSKPRSVLMTQEQYEQIKSQNQ